jgi:hypothetical protein
MTEWREWALCEELESGTLGLPLERQCVVANAKIDARTRRGRCLRLRKGCLFDLDRTRRICPSDRNLKLGNRRRLQPGAFQLLLYLGYAFANPQPRFFERLNDFLGGFKVFTDGADRFRGNGY